MPAAAVAAHDQEGGRHAVVAVRHDRMPLLHREELPADKLNDTHGLEELRAARAADGRLHLGRKDARFWPAVGVALDVLQAVGARVSEAAAVLGISTGNLIDFLQTEPKVWEQANVLRSRFGLKSLKD